MQKLGLLLFFFTLCLTSVSFAQGGAKNYSTFPNIDSILRQVNIDSIVEHLNVDSLLKDSRYQFSEADSVLRHVNVDSIVHSVNIDSIMHRLNIDSIMRHVNLDSLWKANRSKIDSLLKANHFGANDRLKISTNVNTDHVEYLPSGTSQHYFTENGERYYLNILPPDIKGARVDSSYVWLLKSK